MKLVALFLAVAASVVANTAIERELLRLELPRGWKEEPLQPRVIVSDDSDSLRARSEMVSLGGKHAGCLISAREIRSDLFDPKLFLRQPKISSATVVREAPFSEWAGRQGHGVERLIRNDYSGTVIFTLRRKFAFHENGVGVYLTAQTSAKDRRAAERSLARAAADLRAILRSLQVAADAEGHSPRPARTD